MENNKQNKKMNHEEQNKIQVCNASTAFLWRKTTDKTFQPQEHEAKNTTKRRAKKELNNNLWSNITRKTLELPGNVYSLAEKPAQQTQPNQLKQNETRQIRQKKNNKTQEDPKKEKQKKTV